MSYLCKIPAVCFQQKTPRWQYGRSAKRKPVKPALHVPSNNAGEISLLKRVALEFCKRFFTRFYTNELQCYLVCYLVDLKIVSLFCSGSS